MAQRRWCVMLAALAMAAVAARPASAAPLTASTTATVPSKAWVSLGTGPLRVVLAPADLNGLYFYVGDTPPASCAASNGGVSFPDAPPTFDAALQVWACESSGTAVSFPVLPAAAGGSSGGTSQVQATLYQSGSQLSVSNPIFAQVTNPYSITTSGALQPPTVAAGKITKNSTALSANTSTTIAPLNANRVAAGIQCAGGGVNIDETGGTLTSATTGGTLVIPAGAFPYFTPPVATLTAITAYTATAQVCTVTEYLR